MGERVNAGGGRQRHPVDKNPHPAHVADQPRSQNTTGSDLGDDVLISGSVVVALLAIDGAHEDDGPAPAARRILCYINLLTLVLFIEPSTLCL